MKKLQVLVILILTCPVLIFAQAPQGLNYQAVAYNGAGLPVVNQAISVRLSILDASATGTIVYAETQNPTTDNTGLFSIVIGNGIIISGTFSAISWGNGSKWLKTEIDITGGTSYLVMGTSQFMSVPYALYANNAAHAGTFQMPDGFDAITPLEIDGTYIVPAGKNIYLSQPIATIDNHSLYTGFFSGAIIQYPVIGASAGSTIVYTGGAFLIDKIVDWKTIDLATTDLVVPAGKMFVLINQVSQLFYGDNTTDILLNGVQLDPNNATDPIISNRVFKSADVVSVTGLVTVNDHFVINGYFRNN